MTPIKLPSGEYLLVKVPEAVQFQIKKNADHSLLFVLYNWNGFTNVSQDILPPGNWELIGRGSEITENQWQEMLPFSDHYFAKETGHSLIASHNYTPETTILLKKKA